MPFLFAWPKSPLSRISLFSVSRKREKEGGKVRPRSFQERWDAISRSTLKAHSVSEQLKGQVRKKKKKKKKRTLSSMSGTATATLKGPRARQGCAELQRQRELKEQHDGPQLTECVRMEEDGGGWGDDGCAQSEGNVTNSLEARVAQELRRNGRSWKGWIARRIAQDKERWRIST